MGRTTPTKVHLRARAKVDAWNAAHDVGTAVRYRKDDGSVVRTNTRHVATLQSGHSTPVVWLDGIVGCVDLDRVTRDKPKIITTHVYPPIPDRRFDWQAHYEGEEDEQMATGSGPTEAAAILDLIENHPRGE